MWKKMTAVAGICVLSGIMAVQSTAEDGIGEQIGKKVDRGLNTLVGELQKEWAQLRQGIEKMGVQGRVYGRLHWDKALQNASLDVEVDEGQVVVLNGRVPTSEARQRALQLARDTVGVNAVIDKLTLMPPDPPDSK